MSPCVDAWANSDDDDEDNDTRSKSSHDELVADADAYRRKHHTAGYVEGLEQGKSETIQAGFNEGFVQGGKTGFEFGQLKGAAQSLRIFSQQATGSNAWSDAVVDCDKYLSKTSTVKALKAAHAESQVEGEGVGEFAQTLSNARREVESVGIDLHDYPGGNSATA